MDPIRRFVTHFAAARYEDLSSEARVAVKMTVLDTAGAALAGSSSEPGRGIARIPSVTAVRPAAPSSPTEEPASHPRWRPLPTA